MSYIIKSTVVEGEHLTTTVEYTFVDGTVKEVEVTHFQPQDEAAVIQGIQNREVSEQRKLDAVARNAAIKAELDQTPQ